MAKRLNQFRQGVSVPAQKTAPQANGTCIALEHRLSLLLVTHLDVILLRKRFSWDWFRVDSVFRAFTLPGPAWLRLSVCDDDTCRLFLGRRDYRSRKWISAFFSTFIIIRYGCCSWAGPNLLTFANFFTNPSHQSRQELECKRTPCDSLPARLNFWDNVNVWNF